MTLRNERVRKELMRDISDIFRKEVRGLEGVVSIVDVEVSHDNSTQKFITAFWVLPNKLKKIKQLLKKIRAKLDLKSAKEFAFELLLKSNLFILTA